MIEMAAWGIGWALIAGISLAGIRRGSVTGRRAGIVALALSLAFVALVIVLMARIVFHG
jgi:hypothetical protein